MHVTGSPQDLEGQSRNGPGIAPALAVRCLDWCTEIAQNPSVKPAGSEVNIRRIPSPAGMPLIGGNRQLRNCRTSALGAALLAMAPCGRRVIHTLRQVDERCHSI